MRKSLFLRYTLTDEVIEGQTVITVTVTQDDVRDLCLCLCLLQHGLTSELLLRSRNELGIYLEQRTDYKENRLVRISGSTTLQLTVTEAERLVDFFLRYYRDGVAEVDHIDIEAKEEAPNRMDAYVTFVVPDYLPPVSAAEAKRRLGME